MTALCKVCEVEDFESGPIAEQIRAIFPHDVARFGPAFPGDAAYRKHWEVAMAALSLKTAGLLEPDRTALGVGAGNEPTLFWLTNFMHVHATDLYLEAEDWAESANVSMLTDPGRHWPGDWQRRRLITQHMDARELHFEDASFDAVFSSSSLEHFGTDEEIGRSLDEMYRVLKPGGVCSVSTELRVEGHRSGLPGVRMFTAEEIRALVLDNRPWTPLGAVDLSVSQRTRDAEQSFEGAAADVRAHVAQHGELVFHELTWTRYPHIILRQDDLAWTSVHLALQKPLS